MKYGRFIILVLLLTALSMTGCDAVGDNEPRVSQETLERIQSPPQDLLLTKGSWPVLLDSTFYSTMSGDTTGH